MTPLTILALSVVALGMASTASAQTGLSDTSTPVAAPGKDNVALLQQYSWLSRAEVIDQGRVKDIRVDVVSYGPDGQLQRSVLQTEGHVNGRKVPSRDLAESERLNAREYLTGLRDLLDRYTLPLTGKVRDFWNRAIASARQAYGLFATTGRNLVQPGDTLSLWVDPRTGHAQRITVSSTFEGEPVTLTATFETLPSGLNHLAYAEVTVPAKQISLQVQNFNFDRNN